MPATKEADDEEDEVREELDDGELNPPIPSLTLNYSKQGGCAARKHISIRKLTGGQKLETKRSPGKHDHLPPY